MNKFLFTFLCLSISLTLQAQFSFDIYSGGQYNKIKETKHVIKPGGQNSYFVYPNPDYGFQLGIRPKYQLGNFFALSNDTEFGFQYLKETTFQQQTTGKLLKTNFINFGLMAGVFPFAKHKGLHNTLEVMSGVFLNYSFENDWATYLYTMPQYNYSFRHALAWRYQAFSTQLFLNFMQKPVLEHATPPPSDDVRFIYHYHSFGLQISYRLF